MGLRGRGVWRVGDKERKSESEKELNFTAQSTMTVTSRQRDTKELNFTAQSTMTVTSRQRDTGRGPELSLIHI